MSDTPTDIELICLDVDGVLTDGSIHIDDQGYETKRFHVRDGTALNIWQQLGYEVAVITGRRGMALRHRVGELGVRHLFQGSKDKVADFGRLLRELGLKASQAAVVGDDLPDLPLLKLAGYAVAVQDAVAEVRQAADFVTIRPGGCGAVREVIEHLLKAREEWDEALALYGAGSSI